MDAWDLHNYLLSMAQVTEERHIKRHEYKVSKCFKEICTTICTNNINLIPLIIMYSSLTTHSSWIRAVLLDLNDEVANEFKHKITVICYLAVATFIADPGIFSKLGLQKNFSIFAGNFSLS